MKDTYPTGVGECDLGMGQLKKNAGRDGAWYTQLKAQDAEEDGDGDGEGGQRTQAKPKKTP